MKTFFCMRFNKRSPAWSFAERQRAQHWRRACCITTIVRELSPPEHSTSFHSVFEGATKVLAVAFCFKRILKFPVHVSSQRSWKVEQQQSPRRPKGKKLKTTEIHMVEF